MSLEEIRNKIIEYGKQHGEKWNFDKGDNNGHFVKCLDNFTLDYMVGVIDSFLNKNEDK